MNETITVSHDAALEELATVERRLKSFYDPNGHQLDPAEVQASRDFHIEHWIRMAETVIRRDHQQTFYGDLATGFSTLLAEQPNDEISPELQRVVLKELAFMEGHVQAFRLMLQALETVLPR